MTRSQTRPTVDDDLTATDQYCGAGGTSQGLREAGWTTVLAINHWPVAVATHSKNFPHADHWCEDTTLIDMRRLPRARLLATSPICTELSPAGGRRRRPKSGDPDQLALDEMGHVPKEGLVRTRTTFWDVIRATEVRRYDAVLVENVVQAADWELFDHWVSGMCLLGYRVQFVSVSSAHIGDEVNLRAPQWRDRLYILFTRHGIPLPDVEPRPLAWCPVCHADTDALQVWKRPGRRIGQYGAQYYYVCERSTCGHTRVEPYVRPAAAAIDWTDLGTRIGDRPPRKQDGLPLAPATLARVKAGLAMFGPAASAAAPRPGTWRDHSTLIGPAGAPFIDVARAHNRPRGIDEPLAPLTTGRNHGLVVPAGTFVAKAYTPRTWDGQMVHDPAGEPLGALTTGRNQALVVPPVAGGVSAPDVEDGMGGAFYVKQYGGKARPQDMVRPVGVPLGTITTVDHHALVIPFRRGARPHHADAAALSTVATRAQHGLLTGWDDGDVFGCLFRMLKASEHLAAQRFPAWYEVTGNAGERTKQAGNAVSVNVPAWIGRAIAVALGAA